MKPLAIAGIVLAVLGAVVVFRGLNYGSQRSMMRVGDMEVSASEQRAIPTWVGGVAIVGGVLLLVSASRRGA
jgi:hypothetical protein